MNLTTTIDEIFSMDGLKFKDKAQKKYSRKGQQLTSF